jgi:hypothetical protein
MDCADFLFLIREIREIRGQNSFGFRVSDFRAASGTITEPD